MAKVCAINRRIWVVLLFLTIIVFSGCVTRKGVTYFQDMNPSKNDSLSVDSVNYSSIHIQPFDILDIKIKSSDKAFDNLFGSQVIAGTNSSGSTGGLNPQNATYYAGFFVDANGAVDLPLLGKLNLKGMSIPEAKKIIKDKAKEYLVDPFVDIKFLTFKVKVLGNVRLPGVVTILNEKADLLDAISLAGDLTDFGDSKRIKIIRGELDKNPQVYLFDLTSGKSFKSQGFHLRPNDIIYVEPLGRKFFLINISSVLSFVSIVTVTLLAINTIRR